MILVQAKHFTTCASNSTQEVLPNGCITLNACYAPVAFAPRRVSHIVFLISFVLEQKSEDCIGNTEHFNINANDECNSK